MRKLILTNLWLLLIAVASIHAQELQVNVTVNSDQIQGSNKAAFDALQQSIQEFLNNNRWTNMTFAEKERIECNLMLVVKSIEDGVYKCDLQLQSRRPIYNTSYSSPILNFRDKEFNFAYQEMDRIELQQGQFTSNLSSLLMYYAYLVIGYDMDTYSRKGGTPYFQQCENIVSTCQGSSMTDSEQSGWKAFGSSRNRYTIVNNLMDEAFSNFREYMYDYHRLGLDEMANNVDNGRARIAENIAVLRDANRARPAAILVAMFTDAKADELVNLFQQGTSTEKDNVVQILNDIDPTRNETYERIKQSK